MTDISKAAKSKFAIGGVWCSTDSFAIAESFLLRINISAENPTHRIPQLCQAPNRWKKQ